MLQSPCFSYYIGNYTFSSNDMQIRVHNRAVNDKNVSELLKLVAFIHEMLKTIFTWKIPVLSNIQFDLYAVIVESKTEVGRAQGSA